jgi:vacuolar-type H+-ATPase subunit C/Vma6
VIDAANFENLEQGRGLFLEGGSLSREDLEMKRNLPEFIRAFLDEKERGIRRAHLHDRLWELCYGELLELAGKAGCRYLLDYIPWEIELRNRLTALRLRENGGNAEEHAVLPGIRSFDFTVLLSQIEGQKNPLAVERYLDGERLKQIYHCQGNDPFSLDALMAFVSRAMIYGRWERLQEPYDMNNFLYGGG